MKTSDWTPSAIVNFDYSLDIEVIKAQRLQELKDLAEYRERHLKEVLKWTAGECITKPQEYEKDRQAFFSGGSFEGESVRYGVSPLKLTEIVKTQPKISWYRRILNKVSFLTFLNIKGVQNDSFPEAKRSRRVRR